MHVKGMDWHLLKYAYLLSWWQLDKEIDNLSKKANEHISHNVELFI